MFNLFFPSIFGIKSDLNYRAISDIHWSPIHTETIATCSYDSYIHIWDLRVSSDRPTNSFTAWTIGANQVKFNRHIEHIIASSHDSDIRIWDMRRGSMPVQIITAHNSKIYG